MRAALACVLLALAVSAKHHHHHHKQSNATDATNATTPATTTAGNGTTLAVKPAGNDTAIATTANSTGDAAPAKAVGDDAFGVVPCPQGFWWDGHECQDDDECKAHAYVCPAGSKCINTKGSFLCDCGPRHEYRHGECRNSKENARNKDVCFLEYPLQFLELGEVQQKASEKIFKHQAFNPGLVPKGNTGIAVCKESCRNDERCEAAVVQQDADDEKHNKCFHRLLRTDEGRPPTNSVLQNLKEDHDAVTYVKAKCGSCCEYPDQEIKGDPMLSITALNPQDCCSSAGLVVGAVAAVFQSKATAYDEKKNCRIFGKLPEKGYGGHHKAGWAPKPQDPLDRLYPKEGSTTLLPGACREAYKYYKDAGNDCCISYKRSYLRVQRNMFNSDDDSEQPELADLKVDAQAMRVDPKRFPLLTSRRDCCEYCKTHPECTGAQLVEGFCTLLMNPIVKDDDVLALTVGSAVPPDAFASDFESSSADESEIRPSLPEEVELLIRSQTACEDLFCIYRMVEPNPDDIQMALELTEDRTSILRRCWAKCQEKKDCHAVDVNEKDLNNQKEIPGGNCTLYSNRSPVGFRPLDVDEDEHKFAALFKPNPDQTCSPALEPMEIGGSVEI